jgi:hypothetical protein
VPGANPRILSGVGIWALVVVTRRARAGKSFKKDRYKGRLPGKRRGREIPLYSE